MDLYIASIIAVHSDRYKDILSLLLTTITSSLLINSEELWSLIMPQLTRNQLVKGSFVLKSRDPIRFTSNIELVDVACKELKDEGTRFLFKTLCLPCVRYYDSNGDQILRIMLDKRNISDREFMHHVYKTCTAVSAALNNDLEGCIRLVPRSMARCLHLITDTSVCDSVLDSIKDVDESDIVMALRSVASDDAILRMIMSLGSIQGTSVRDISMYRPRVMCDLIRSERRNMIGSNIYVYSLEIYDAANTLGLALHDELVWRDVVALGAAGAMKHTLTITMLRYIVRESPSALVDICVLAIDVSISEEDLILISKSSRVTSFVARGCTIEEILQRLYDLILSVSMEALAVIKKIVGDNSSMRQLIRKRRKYLITDSPSLDLFM